MSKDITVGRTWTLADDVSHLINGNNLEDPTRSNLNGVKNKLLLNSNQINALFFLNRKEPNSLRCQITQYKLTIQ